MIRVAKPKSPRGRILAVLLPLLVALGPPAMAQDQTDGTDAWHQSIHLYLLAPTIDGTAGIGPANADVDVDPGTVFDTLDGAFLGMYTAEKDGWGVFLDVVYMDLEADLEAAGGVVAGELGNRQFTGALSGSYRLNDQWQLLAGGMYTDVTVTLDVTGPLQNRRAKRSESWWDPFVGAKVETALGERWHFAGFAYLGGFGVGSDLMWSANAGFGYRLTERNSLTLLYRYISYDYEDGRGADRFRFDIAEHGPALGWRFEF